MGHPKCLSNSGEFLPVLPQQAPGFAVGFVVVLRPAAAGAGRAVRVEADVQSGLWVEHPVGRDEIPDLRLQDVESEQVDVAGIVVPFAVNTTAAAETADVSAASAMAAAFDLDAQQASALLDAYPSTPQEIASRISCSAQDRLIGEIVSVGLEHVVSVEGGHDEELDPLSTLLAGFEFLPTRVSLTLDTILSLDSILSPETILNFDAALTFDIFPNTDSPPALTRLPHNFLCPNHPGHITREISPANTKGATWGRAFVSQKEKEKKR
ncbi:MAG TPA: hypothetical protein VGG04_08580 [Candidatus Sulfotelmatobacter sp.]